MKAIQCAFAVLGTVALCCASMRLPETSPATAPPLRIHGVHAETAPKDSTETPVIEYPYIQYRAARVLFGMGLGLYGVSLMVVVNGLVSDQGPVKDASFLAAAICAGAGSVLSCSSVPFFVVARRKREEYDQQGVRPTRETLAIGVRFVTPFGLR